VSRNGARDVLIVTEPDEVVEAGTPVSRSWKRLSGGDEPPRKPPSDGDLFRTINHERGLANIAALRRQKPERWGEVQVIEDPQDLLRTPSTGEHAQTVVIIAKNTEEFREAIRIAAQEHRFKHKQVVLFTCADVDIPVIREHMLQRGEAQMVWTVDRQLEPAAARLVAERMTKIANETPPAERVRVNRLVREAARQLEAEGSLPSSKAAPFRAGSAYVEVRPEFRPTTPDATVPA